MYFNWCILTGVFYDTHSLILKFGLLNVYVLLLYCLLLHFLAEKKINNQKSKINARSVAKMRVSESTVPLHRRLKNPRAGTRAII